MSVESLSVHRVNIQQDVGTADGAGQVPESWVAAQSNVMCRIRPVTADERAKWSGEPIIATHVVYFPDTSVPLTEKSRLIYGTRVFAVIDVRNVDELDRYLIVRCRELR